MPCHRCHGLMTVDSYIDKGSSSDPLWLRTWRCGNSAKVTVPGVVTNRIVHRNWLRNGRPPPRRAPPARFTA